MKDQLLLKLIEENLLQQLEISRSRIAMHSSFEAIAARSYNEGILDLSNNILELIYKHKDNEINQD